MQIGNITHGYDGFVISIQDRKWWAIFIEWIWDKFMIICPCCHPWIQKAIFWETEKRENIGMMAFRLLNLPNKLVMKGVGSGQCYPVTDEWVEENCPDVWADEMLQRLNGQKTPGHGTKCPECGEGRVNGWNTDSIKNHGMCLHCRIRVGTYATTQ